MDVSNGIFNHMSITIYLLNKRMPAFLQHLHAAVRIRNVYACEWIKHP